MKIKHTTAPLPIETIKEYFLDKDMLFLIDYANSKLADKIFLTYISNLDMPIDIELSKDFPIEKTFTLLDAYLDVKTISKVETLTMMIAHIILKAAGVDTKEALVNTFLTDEQAQEYIDTRKEKIETWLHFLDSTMLYLIYTYQDLNEHIKVEENFPVVEDINYIGLNVVNLFQVPGFSTCYFGLREIQNLTFFKEQFTKSMFKGKPFFEYYKTDENIFVPILLALVENKLPLDPKEIFKDIE
jgi:hypothetical protein